MRSVPFPNGLFSVLELWRSTITAYKDYTALLLGLTRLSGGRTAGFSQKGVCKVFRLINLLLCERFDVC